MTMATLDLSPEPRDARDRDFDEHERVRARAAWSHHPLYGLIRTMPAGTEIFDEIVAAALAELNCECLSLVTPVTARVLDREDADRFGTARVIHLPDGRHVLALYWGRNRNPLLTPYR